MGAYTDYTVLAAIGAGMVGLLSAIWRGSRRASQTDVSPVSEQWLAERRRKLD
jgi:hypothetical protein